MVILMGFSHTWCVVWVGGEHCLFHDPLEVHTEARGQVPVKGPRRRVVGIVAWMGGPRVGQLLEIHRLTGSTVRTLLHGRSNPKD